MEGTFFDLAQRMRALLDKLDKALLQNDDDENASSTEEEAAWWEELQDHAENLDLALLFCQVGGLKTLCNYLELPLDTVKNERRVLAALSVLAALTQNNPRVQTEVVAYCARPDVELDLLGLLCGIVLLPQGEGKNEHSARLRAKALHALSCTVRSPGPTPLETRFVSEWALPVFRAALGGSSEEEEGEEERVRAKALFFLQALLGADHADKARAEQLGLALLPLVARLLEKGGSGDGRRHLAMAVVSETANRLGGAGALLSSAGGVVLREAMAVRREAIAALAPGSVEREEAEEEARFWAVVECGGRFLRDGEREGDGAAGAGGGGGQQQEQEQEQEEEEAAPPVLLLEGAPRLTGASQAP